MKKFFFTLLSFVFLSVSCGLFGKPAPAGIIKTVNGGTDWQFSNSFKNSKSSSMSGLNISRMGFDPQNRETVFASSFSGGLYKSEDSGQSWSRILSKILVYDFAVHPFDSKTIYAAGALGQQGKLLKTADGGASWQEVYNEAGGNNPVRAVAINPGQPNQIVIGTETGTAIKSFDGGQSWKLSKNFSDRTNRILWQSGQVYILLKTKGLFRAESFSDNYEDLTASLTNPVSVGSSSYNTGRANSFNQLFVDLLASNLIYITTNLGPQKSTDGGKSWTAISLPVKSAQNNRAIAVAKNSSNIVFTSVGSTIFKSTDGGGTWQTQSVATAGFVNYILIDPQLPQIVYGGIYVASQ